MPWIKAQLYNACRAEMERRLSQAQYKLDENRRQIRRLSEEQKTLKQQRNEASRLMAEFRKKSEQEK